MNKQHPNLLSEFIFHDTGLLLKAVISVLAGVDAQRGVVLSVHHPGARGPGRAGGDRGTGLVT